MPRLTYPNLEEAPDGIRDFFRSTPYDLAILRLVSHAQGAFEGWLRLGGGLTLYGSLDARTQELAITVATFPSSPEYEYAHHVTMASKAGITPAQLEAIQARIYDCDRFTEHDQAILRYADALVWGVKADAAAFQSLRRHLTDRQVVELTLLIGLYMMNSRLAANAELTLRDDEQFGSRARADATAS